MEKWCGKVARRGVVIGPVIRLESNMKSEEVKIEEPSILFADELDPSQTIKLDTTRLLGVVTRRGNVNSHSAIIARVMNIPAIVGVPIEWEKLTNGMQVIVNGTSGEVIVEPDEDTCKDAQKHMQEEEKYWQELEAYKGKENLTKDGRSIQIYANISRAEDVSAVIENDAGGVGLFRSECLYLGRQQLPSEEEQFEIYRSVLEQLPGKAVIIRTLDIGAEKQADCLKLEQEMNPVMGYRAIRICLKQPEIFKTQLRALFRAASYGNLAIMYPMITSMEEMEQISMIVEDVREELRKEGVEFRVPKQGVMMETPAAVMISEELAQAVDFFSIGTNDLTQYTLAMDRQNERIEEFYDPVHPAVLRMIKYVVNRAHHYKIPVAVCGEMAADLELVDIFLRIGVDELSVAPSMVLPLRKRIRELDLWEINYSK